jgi:hypothetical protein
MFYFNLKSKVSPKNSFPAATLSVYFCNIFDIYLGKTVSLKAQRTSRTKRTRRIRGAAVAVIQTVPPQAILPATVSRIKTNMQRRKKRRKRSLMEKEKSLDTELFLLI